MKDFPYVNFPSVFIEIGETSLKLLDGDDGLELSLDRQENGGLTPLCAERLTLSLRVFLKKHNWRPRLRAFCALGARGVSLRRLSLPASSKEELQRLLPLQIESEFPLSPDELAWGYRPLNPGPAVRNGAPATQELLVAAVKSGMLEQYAALLSGCGLIPVFTLAALARINLCPKPPKGYAVLDIGRSHSELVSFEDGVPAAIRVLPWGGEDLTRALGKSLGISQAEAEKMKLRLDEAEPGGELQAKVQGALRAELDSLARSLQAKWLGQRLYLSGASARFKELVPLLARSLGGGVECERIELGRGEGRSAAILGLKRSCETNTLPPPLILQAKAARAPEAETRPGLWRWAVLAGLLALGCLGLRYAEAIFLKPRLVRKLAEIRAYREKLPGIEQELSFLQYLKTNQPPYLEPLSALAGAAPSGTRIDSLSVSRRGDFSLRGSVRDGQQLADFRSKLIDSGSFSNVVVEEQTPTPDRQKLIIRMVGQWRLSSASRPSTGEVTNARPADGPRPQQPAMSPDGRISTETGINSNALRTGTVRGPQEGPSAVQGGGTVPGTPAAEEAAAPTIGNKPPPTVK